MSTDHQTDVAASLAKLKELAAGGTELAEEASAFATSLVERHPPHTLAPFTETGKAQLDALELAHNTLAWNQLHRTRTHEGLLAALESAKAGLRLDHRRPEWLMNTTVRVLLALLRPNEAYVVARDTERRLPETSVFADLEEARSAWALTRTPAHDARAITASFQQKAREGETFEEIINRANRWLRALYDAGLQTLVEVGYADTDLAVRRVHAPIEPSTVRELEEELGFPLPPSYARFLTEVGGVAFLNDWWDETTAPKDILEKSRTQAGLDMPNDTVWQAAEADLRLLRVCDFHNGEDWIYLCHWRDHRGEAPTFLRYHDEGELYYGFSPEALEGVAAGKPGADGVRGKKRPVSDGAPSEAGPSSDEPDLSAQLSRVLADDALSQRGKLKLLQSEWVAKITDASDDEALATLHVIRRSIKSKKLRGDRDALVGDLRRDGLAADAPLPSLPESLRPKKSTSKPQAPVFDSFHLWLSDRVDEMMDEVTDRVAPAP